MEEETAGVSNDDDNNDEDGHDNVNDEANDAAVAAEREDDKFKEEKWQMERRHNGGQWTIDDGY